MVKLLMLQCNKFTVILCQLNIRTQCRRGRIVCVTAIFQEFIWYIFWSASRSINSDFYWTAGCINL